jgi:hypothetical protein
MKTRIYIIKKLLQILAKKDISVIANITINGNITVPDNAHAVIENVKVIHS